jgi:hypothetical protein
MTKNLDKATKTLTKAKITYIECSYLKSYLTPAISSTMCRINWQHLMMAPSIQTCHLSRLRGRLSGRLGAAASVAASGDASGAAASVAASSVAAVYDVGAKWSIAAVTASAADPVSCMYVYELVWTLYVHLCLLRTFELV